MSDAEIKGDRWPVTRRAFRRGLAFLAVAAIAAVMVAKISTALERQPTPAGFGRGLVQGILMPMALPNLLVGKDVSIYASNNTGVSYKLGYTAGVNACGAVFFGWFFWRLRRFQRWNVQRGG